MQTLMMSMHGIKLCRELSSGIQAKSHICPARAPLNINFQSGSTRALSTMVSGRFLLLSATCSMLVVLVSSEDFLETRSPGDTFKTQEEKDLIEALQEVLEKLKNKQTPSLEKKLGWVPSCDAGEQCAVRKGSRIGKLCSCPRGTSCNFAILKCL